MKKKLIFLFLMLSTGLIQAETKKESRLILEKDGIKNFNVTKDNIAKIGFGDSKASLIVTKQLNLKENSKLNFVGNIADTLEEPILALDYKGKGFDKGIEINKGATLDVNVKLKNSRVYYPKYTLIGARTFSRKDFKIEKDGNLNILVHSNRPLVQQHNINAPHKDNKDLFHQLYESSIALELGNNLTSNGNINIESTGWGISFNEKKKTKKLNFKEGAKTNIKAGLIGIYQPKDGTTVTFENGSKTKLISGMYGLVARKAEIKKGAQIDAYGKYGLGNFEYKGYGDKYYFEKGSNVNILANRAALYSISLQEGETKLNAKAKNIFQQVDTRHEKTQNLDTFTVGEGSILEGNIEESWNAKIKLDKGTKLFINDRLDTNLIAKGDIYVGPRAAYEKIENKVYEKEVKKQLGDMDAVVGASVILFGDLKNQNLDNLKTNEIDEHFGKPRDIHPFAEVDPNKYYTVRFNDYSGKNYENDNRKVKINLENAKIHLRFGKAKDGRINDKLFFSKLTTVEGKGAELVLKHDEDADIKKTEVIDWLEEDLTGKNESSLEKLNLVIDNIDFGKYSFTKRMGRTGNKFVVSSLYKGLRNEDFKINSVNEENNEDTDKIKDGNMIGKVNLAKGKTSSAIGSYNLAKNSSSAVGRVNTAEGSYSSAFGGNNTAKGEGSSAFGTTNIADGIHSVAFGNGNITKGEKSSTFGVGNTVIGETSTALGYRNTINGTNNFVLGNNVEVRTGLNNVVVLGNNSQVGTSNTVSVGSALSQRKIVYVSAGTDDTDAVNFKQHKEALNIDTAKWKTVLGINGSSSSSGSGSSSGLKNTALGVGSIGIGNDNVVSGNYSTTIGYKNKISGNNSGAFGDPNIVSGNKSYAFGNDNVIDGDNNFILGNNVKIKTEINNSVVLGNKSTVSSSNEVSVGSEQIKRKVTNIADGEVSETSTDAVNGRQLYKISKQVGTETIKEIKNDMKHVKNEMKGIGSLSAALSALHPMQYDEKAPNQIMAGVGSYGDKKAVAIGLTHYLKENVMMTAGLALSDESKTNTMANIGLTWKLGKKSLSSENMPKNILENEIKRVTNENRILKTRLQNQEIRMKNLEEKLEILLKNK